MTAERFLPDPYSTEPGARMYRTGDLGRWRDDGNLEFLGRDDFQVKIRGFRIELGEIESRLRSARGIREACVLAQEDAPGEKRLIAYVVAQPESVPTSTELRAWLQAALAEHMVPSAFVILDALPLTPNGKLDRKALPVPGRERSEVEYVAPRNAIEERLCTSFAQVLRFDRVGIHDHFFELGGNSLLVVKLHAMLAAHFPGQLAIADFFQHTSVAKLAEFLGSPPTAAQRLPDSVSRAENRRARLADRTQKRAQRGTSSIEQ